MINANEALRLSQDNDMEKIEQTIVRAAQNGLTRIEVSELTTEQTAKLVCSGYDVYMVAHDGIMIPKNAYIIDWSERHG